MDKNSVETKPCKCGKKMIKEYGGIVLLTNPPQYTWNWWCGCGNTEPGGREFGKEVTIRDRWEEANG